MRTGSGLTRIASIALALLGLLLLGSVPGLARDKYETIDATAWGTSTQLGRNVGITLTIYQYSTPEDQEILYDAFQKGQNQGLVNALEKMKAVGHISITGTLGYDVSFIKLIETPTGRTIRFVTNRPINFREAYWDTQTQYYNLTAGEININTQDKSKSGPCPLCVGGSLSGHHALRSAYDLFGCAVDGCACAYTEWPVIRVPRVRQLGTRGWHFRTDLYFIRSIY